MNVFQYTQCQASPNHSSGGDALDRSRIYHRCFYLGDQGRTEDILEEVAAVLHSPDFQLTVRFGDQRQDKAAWILLDFQAYIADQPQMTAVQPFRDPQDGRQSADDPPFVANQAGHVRMAFLGETLAVIEGDIGDDLDLQVIEAQQIAVAD